jgi:hypothetical protein
MADSAITKASSTQSGKPSLRQLAREEFWIVAKTFFAPIYLLLLLWRFRSGANRKIGGSSAPADAAWLTPAE